MELGSPGQCYDSNPDTSRRLGVHEQLPASAALDGQSCCQLLEDAHSKQPGEFARCAARFFYNLDRALARNYSIPLLADLTTEATEPWREVVLALRAAEPQRASEFSDEDGATDSAATAFGDLEAELSLEAVQPPAVADVVAAASIFRPISSAYQPVQELVAPLTGQPPLQQFEAPLSSDRREVPLPAVLNLIAGELAIVRLADLEAAAEEEDGVLQLHLQDLPPGSTVLYARSWPEPRSLMDFGHAIGHVVNNVSTIWRPSMLSATYFAVMPGESALVTAFFSVRRFLDVPEGLIAAPPVDPSVEPIAGIQQDISHEYVAGAIVLGIGAIALVAAFVRWQQLFGRHQGLVEQPSRTTSEGVIAQLAARSLSFDNGWSSGDDEIDGSSRPRPIFSSLKKIGGRVRTKLNDFGDATNRMLLSVSTRAGTTRRSYEDCEVELSLFDADSDEGESGGFRAADEGRPLLAVSRRQEPDEDDGTEALMKLRPALQDSLGGGLDDADIVESPLVDSERMHMLSR
jgi:hypothetical protein